MIRHAAGRAAFYATLCLSVASGSGLAKDTPTSPEHHELRDIEQVAEDLMHELGSAAVRLPLAAALGAVLALRPRRHGARDRRPVVVRSSTGIPATRPSSRPRVSR